MELSSEGADMLKTLKSRPDNCGCSRRLGVGGDAEKENVTCNEWNLGVNWVHELHAAL